MQPGGSQGGTYAGNVIACASANATLDVLTDDKILENVSARGQEMINGLQEIRDAGAPISDIRGLGLMIGMDFDMKRVEKGFAGKVAKEGLSRGIILLTTGIYETLRFIPPLNVSSDEIKHGLVLIEEAVNSAIEN